MKPRFSAWFEVCALLLVFLTEVNGKRKSRTVSDNNVDNDVCVQLIERIFYGHVKADNPPDISGEWTSERCEVRPGPEYVLRKYKFEASSQFSAHVYYYGDADCSNPLYLIRAEGAYTRLQESWTVPGGTEVDYRLEKVHIMMYTDRIAEDLGSRINKTCPKLNLEWKPYERYEIYTYTELDDEAEFEEEDEEDISAFIDRDCTSALYFSFHELQLMRLEERHHRHNPARMLYLGDIHTDRKQRQLYRPTSYQDPLFPAQQQGCRVCRALVNSDDFYPPSLALSVVPVLQVDLVGEWFSERCETRPRGMFLTRRLLFKQDGQSWEGYYYHYDDALCREPSFTIHASGNYVPGKLSGEVGRSYNFDFKVLDLKITPGDPRIAETLNVDDGTVCGVKGTWRIGEEQDVTGTNGCEHMGIRVPHVEYEIVRVEKDHDKFLLYLGQRPSDGSHPSTPKKRPTSFQSPLLKCSKPITVTPPTVRKYVLRASGAPSCRFVSLALQISLSLLVVSFGL